MTVPLLLRFGLCHRIYFILCVDHAARSEYCVRQKQTSAFAELTMPMNSPNWHLFNQQCQWTVPLYICSTDIVDSTVALSIRQCQWTVTIGFFLMNNGPFQLTFVESTKPMDSQLTFVESIMPMGTATWYVLN